MFSLKVFSDDDPCSKAKEIYLKAATDAINIKAQFRDDLKEFQMANPKDFPNGEHDKLNNEKFRKAFEDLSKLEEEVEKEISMLGDIPSDCCKQEENQFIGKVKNRRIPKK